MHKILAIDDKKDNLLVLKSILADMIPGCQFFQASSGKEGIELAVQCQPDVILLDLIMPGMDGYETCRTIKADPVLSRLPVIILTAGRAGASDRVKALQSGAEAFLTKPVDPAELTALVNSMARIKHSENTVRNERDKLEEIIAERTLALKTELDERRKTESELKRSYRELETSRLATLNLMEDLKSEIDQRKRSEEILLESQNRFKDLYTLLRSISDNMMDMLWAKDLEKNYLFANKAICDRLLIATDTNEPIGKNDLFFAQRQRELHQDNPLWHTFGEVCRDSDQIVMDSGEPHQFDEYGNIQGEFLFLDVRKSPLLDKDGRIIGTVGSAQDITKEKEMVILLQENERQLSTLVSNLPGMVYRCMNDPHWTMLFMSDACLKITGYTKEELLGNSKLSFNDIIHPDYRDFLWDRWQEVLPRREMFESEYPILTATGETRWVWERGRGIFNDEGQLLYLEGYIEDITERKKAVESLRESEERYQTFINSTDDFAFLKDENYKYLFINQANAAFFGKQTGEILGKTDNELMPAHYAEGCIRSDMMALQASGVVVSEEVVEGRIFETRKFPVTLMNGKIGVGGYIRDITERRVSEEALHESEERFRNLYENATIGLYRTTPSGSILLANRTLIRILGFDSLEELIQRDLNLSGFASDSPRSRFMEIMERDGEVIGFETTWLRKDGTPIQLQESAHAVYGDGGKIIFYDGTVEDITIRKSAEDQIKRIHEELEKRVKERTAQLEASNKELESFSYSVSHDLRAPLRAIDGFTRILFEDYMPRLDAEGKRVCGVIKENALRMGQLIDDLLALSRLNRTDLNHAKIDMAHLVNLVFNEIATESEKQKSRLIIHPLHEIYGDQVLIRQVWTNLISNAIKFSSQREEIRIEISSTHENGRVTFNVTDNGAGFDMKYAGKLFGAFQRLHSVKEFDGTGIGLAIVQRIVHRHGGEVWAKGEVNKGATFYFSIPEKRHVDEEKTPVSGKAAAPDPSS